MGFLSTIFSPVTAIVNTVGSAYESRNKVKEAKVKADSKLQQAKSKALIRAYEQGLISEALWDQTALEMMEKSWKDELQLIIWTAPFIIPLIPSLADNAQVWADIVQQYPWWYITAWAVITGTIWGQKHFTKASMTKSLGTKTALQEVSELNTILK